MSNSFYSDIILISGTSNIPLAQEVADNLAIPLCHMDIGRFSDGEINVAIGETIRGGDIYVMQSTCAPVNDNLMELLIIIDALKRASAGRINAVIPYYGYGRQDRKAKGRTPITAKLVADLLVTAGADRVISFDLHADQIQGFFNIPVDRLLALPLIAEYIKEENLSLDNLVVVSPDVGSVKRSRALAEYLNIPLAIIDKRRPKDNVAEVMNVIGDVEGKKVIMIDDMIDTGGTIIGAAEALVKLGATEILCACTHPILSGASIEKLEKSAITKLIVTNTIKLPPEKQIDKIHVVSVGPHLAKVIKRIHEAKSISSVF